MIDLKHGYHQMPLAEESRACTAMSGPLGPIQSKVMAMGVTNGNAAFQRMLENLLEPVRDCADPSLDDVIIASRDPSMRYEELLEAHETDVTRALDLLVRHKLTGSGMRPWPNSTTRLCMFLVRTTPWRTVTVGGPIPPARA